VRTLSLLFAAALLGSACSPEPKAPDPLAAVPLDHGARWRADEHTRRTFAAMLEEVQRAETEGIATAVLAERLQGHLNALFAGCTMEGPAHEALHSYLTVLLPRIDAMRAGNPDVAADGRTQAVAILRRFPEYFE